MQLIYEFYLVIIEWIVDNSSTFPLLKLLMMYITENWLQRNTLGMFTTFRDCINWPWANYQWKLWCARLSL